MLAYAFNKKYIFVKYKICCGYKKSSVYKITSIIDLQIYHTKKQGYLNKFTTWLESLMTAMERKTSNRIVKNIFVWQYQLDDLVELKQGR